MGRAIVVIAILYVALHTLDVLAAHAAASLILFHHSVSFLSSDQYPDWKDVSFPSLLYPISNPLYTKKEAPTCHFL